MQQDLLKSFEKPPGKALCRSHFLKRPINICEDYERLFKKDSGRLLYVWRIYKVYSSIRFGEKWLERYISAVICLLKGISTLVINVQHMFVLRRFLVDIVKQTETVFRGTLSAVRSSEKFQKTTRESLMQEPSFKETHKYLGGLWKVI